MRRDLESTNVRAAAFLAWAAEDEPPERPDPAELAADEAEMVRFRRDWHERERAAWRP